MKVTYIHHSCFLVETKNCYYLFDYFKGDLPILEREKPILVLASHRHYDHYQRKIFSILKEMGMQEIYAVLSHDIPARVFPKDIPCITVSPCQSYELPQGQHLSTYRSTDEGVAFLLEDDEERFYHAGDLNDWVWEEETEEYNRQMTGNYRKQIQLLSEDLHGRSLTSAFVVLDPRQGADYASGILYFLAHIPADCVYPMHYWEKPQIIEQFLQEYPQYQNQIQLTETAHA